MERADRNITDLVEHLHGTFPWLRQSGIDEDLFDAIAGFEASVTARALGLEPEMFDIRRPDDIEKGFAAPPDVDALYVVVDGLLNNDISRIAELALRARLPTMLGLPDELILGGLMAYGPNSGALFRRAAEYINKILRGAKPGDLPVEQPSRFELMINFKTAKALGLSLPRDLLAQADEVIE